MYCNIANFTDIANIDFYKETDVNFSHEFIVYNPEIYLGSSLSEDEKKFGYCVLLAPPVHKAQIDDMSGELSVDSATSVGGTKYKCNLSFDIEYGGSLRKREEYRKQLIDLQRNNYIIVITYISGDKHIIRSDKDGWHFSYKENKGTVTISLSIENISGAQRVLNV